MAYTKKAKPEASAVQVAKLPTNREELFRVKVNKDTQKFYVEGQEEYGEFSEFILRPTDVLKKLVAYKEKDGELTTAAESTLFYESKDAEDTWGNDSESDKICGRVIRPWAIKELSEDEKEENKSKAKYYLYLFGIASIGKNDPIIIDFRIGGSKFMEVMNLLDQIKKEKREYHNAEIKVTATKNKNADYDWPDINFMLDFTRELPLVGLEDVVETIEGYIADHNDKIGKKAQKYKAWKAGNSTNSGTYKKGGTSFKKKGSKSSEEAPF